MWDVTHPVAITCTMCGLCFSTAYVAVRKLCFNFHLELGMVLRMDEGAQPDVSSGGRCDLAPHPLSSCSVNIGTSLCTYSNAACVWCTLPFWVCLM